MSEDKATHGNGVSFANQDLGVETIRFMAISTMRPEVKDFDALSMKIEDITNEAILLKNDENRVTIVYRLNSDRLVGRGYLIDGRAPLGEEGKRDYETDLEFFREHPQFVGSQTNDDYGFILVRDDPRIAPYFN